MKRMEWAIIIVRIKIAKKPIAKQTRAHGFGNRRKVLAQSVAVLIGDLSATGEVWVLPRGSQSLLCDISLFLVG